MVQNKSSLAILPGVWKYHIFITPLLNWPNYYFLIQNIIEIANHKAILKNVGIEPVDYPYYDPKTIGLDFTGFLSSLKSAPSHSVFLIHACAHNPTGVDPTPEQWKEISDIVKVRRPAHNTSERGVFFSHSTQGSHCSERIAYWLQITSFCFFHATTRRAPLVPLHCSEMHASCLI